MEKDKTQSTQEHKKTWASLFESSQPIKFEMISNDQSPAFHDKSSNRNEPTELDSNSNTPRELDSNSNITRIVPTDKKVIILDSGPIITGCLMNFVQNYDQWEFYSVYEVLHQEVKDKRSRDMLERFPIKIIEREPSKEALQAISIFAKKTGDYSGLSKVDLKLLALTYDFEAQLNGTAHIKTEPNIKEVTTDGPIGIDPFYKNVQNLKQENKNKKEQENKNKEENENKNDIEEDDEDNCNDDWITPDNIDEKTIGLYGGVSGDKEEIENGVKRNFIGLISTDFAMQNVLLLMGLKPLSVDGYALKTVKQWIYKCFACFEVVKQTNKMFCPKCGYYPLLKVAVQVDNEGQVVYKNPPDRFFSTKGTKFNIPQKKGGRSSSDVVFSEDEYNQAKKAHRYDPNYKVTVGYSKNPNIPKKKIGKKNKSFRN